MTRGIKVRIAAFLILSAVGIVYVAASYLGFVDKVLGRGFTIHATLPSSGGLFEGSEVTYRGVKIGEVARMDATRDGVRLDLEMHHGAELPLDSPMYVHNLSAVGEQYLDFEPKSGEAPYAEAGDTIEGGEASLPVDEADLLVELDQFVTSVDRDSLETTVRELGLMFNDTGVALQKMLDSGGKFIDEAAAHEDETVGVAPERADRAAHPARRGREHQGLLPQPEPDHRQPAQERRGSARHAPGHATGDA